MLLSLPLKRLLEVHIAAKSQAAAEVQDRDLRGPDLLCHVELMGMTNSFTSMVGLVDTLAMLYTFTSGAPTQEEKTCRDTLHRKFDSCFSDPNTSI